MNVARSLGAKCYSEWKSFGLASWIKQQKA